MYIGSNNANYYSQYYPYVGASPQVISGYDNGNYTFIAYGYFNNTFDGWKGYQWQVQGVTPYTPQATQYGIEMINNQQSEGTYILPPNNGNIPKIPLIVEEAWYYNQGGDANIIALFGNTNNYIDMYMINLPIYAAFEYMPYSEGTYLGSTIEEKLLNYTYFPTSGGTFYSYLIVNSTYAQTGYYIYNSNQVWAPLTLLDMYPLSYNPNYGNYTYYNLNYNPYQYPTLEISAGAGNAASYQYVEWVVARAYPPNGIMPSIYIS
jgi:hypothetical protein